MLLTVFTPTYNRAHLLRRLYTSLKNQTCFDFEWLIVDDDSADDTEAVVSQFMAEKAPFEIRYLKQKHGGKHRAVNYGLSYAAGEYFFIVDSDDWLPENAVELLEEWLQGIRNQPSLCGVAGQKMFPDGAAVGETFRSDKPVDADSLEAKRLHISGDKAEVVSTKVMREHPFPEFEGEFFATEDICWNAIAADGYKLRWFQEPIYFCEYLEDGLSRTGANELSGHMANFRGYCYYVRQSMRVKNRLESYRDFADYQKTCDTMGLSEKQRAEMLQWSEGQYRWYRMIVMPLIRNIKRIIYVTGKVKTVLPGKTGVFSKE